MTHINELIDFTVNVFIVHNQKILLRFHDKYHFWGGSASGHIELNEDPNQAAIRETKEEVGLDIQLIDTNPPIYSDDNRVKKLVSPAYLDIHKISDTHRHIGMVYFAVSTNNKVKPLDDEDRSDKWMWLTKEELEKMDMWEEQKFYALKALEFVTHHH